MKTNTARPNLISIVHYILLLFILLAYLSAIRLQAQNEIKPHFEFFTDKGFPGNNFVRAILQDRHGLIWLGAEDGLHRFDGYSFKTYRHDPDDPNSLSSNLITSLFEDSNGDLWIMVTNTPIIGAMPGVINRLNRATGKIERFEHDPNDPGSISGNQATTVIEDSKNNIWIGTETGLNRFDRATGKFERFEHHLEDITNMREHTIFYLFEDSKGYLWVSPYYPPGGLSRFDPSTGKFDHFWHDPDDPNSLCSDDINCLYEDSQENLWIGTGSAGGISGLNRLDLKTGRIERFLHDPNDPHSLASGGVSKVFEDSRQDLWIVVNQGGINRLDRTTGKFQRFNTCDDRSTRIIEDSMGNLWVSTLTTGIALFDRKNQTFRCFQNDDYAGFGRHVLDRRGNIWMNTNKGLARMYTIPAGFHHYQHDSEDPGSIIFENPHLSAVFEDSEGTIWFGSGGGVDRLDKESGKFEHFQRDPNDPNSITLLDVWMIMEDRGGSIWIGGQGPLDRLDRKTGKLVQSFPRNSRDSTTTQLSGISCGLEDPEGNLWFGGGLGINKLDRRTGLFQHYIPFPVPEDMWLGNYVWSMIMDSEGYIWAGTWYKGLCRLDPATGAFEYFRHEPGNPSSLSNNSVFALYEDSEKNIWAGTVVGLNRLNRADSTFTRYFVKDGLPNADIKGILEDDHGRLWISTADGISRFDPATETFVNFDKYDGFGGNNFVPLSHFKNPRTGQLFFGGWHGFNIFHPYSMKVDSFAPPVIISSFTRYSRELGLPVVDDFIADKNRIDLSYRDNILSFEFAGLNFHKTSKNQYKYQLEGFSDQWYELGHKREVTFTDLHPGNYTLRVMAANADGIWNPKAKELAIKITPPWWWSPWSKLVYVSLLLGLLYGLYMLLLHRKMTLLETSQLRTLDAIKSKFYTNITHEFRTPLTVIQGMSDQIIDKVEELPKEKIRDNATIVKRNSAQLLTMVNQMLDLRKLESGSLPVNMVKGDVLQYLRYLAESFYSYAAERGVGLHFMSDLDELVIDYDEDKLLHIVSNLLSNAIKFTPEGGNVYFSVDASTKTSKVSETFEVLELRVKDTGIGISEEQLPFIFDRFYQADTNTTRKREGTGIGLALTKELVKILNGTIEVKSKMEKGTTFIITLPISREATEVPATHLAMEDKMLGFTAAKPIKETLSKIPINREDMPVALVIEDNPDVIRYLSSCLEGSYKVVTAMDGQIGVDTALDLIPDIIVSDVMMPEKNGFEVCQTLKQDVRTSHIPIILLTAKADIDSKLEGFSHGADAYLAKPFNPKELDIRLEQLIELRKKLQARYQDHAAVKQQPGNLEDEFLSKLQQVIQDNISDENFGIQHLCRSIGMSRTQLHRKIKALTNKSTSLFIRSIRLTKARELLKSTKLNISEIAYEVGFSNPVYFTQVFTEEFGEPPSAVRS